MRLHHKLPVGTLIVALVVLIAMMACVGETITIERATEEPEPPTRTRSTPTEEPSRTPRTVFSQAATPTVAPTEPARGQALAPLLSDGATLQAFYKAAGGGDWYNNEGWLVETDLNQWYRVTADSAGQVSALELGGNNLSGELPEGLGSLENLTVLDLSDNQLSGPLPEEVSNLTGLEELYLNGNQFSGPMPGGLGALTELTDLWLHDNGFGAEFPSELATLANLESVTIWGNRYSWPTPTRRACGPTWSGWWPSMTPPEETAGRTGLAGCPDPSGSTGRSFHSPVPPVEDLAGVVLTLMPSEIL